VVWPRVDQLDHRHAEGKGLPRPGGGLNEHIAPGEDVFDDESLDGERFGDAAGGESAAHGFGHAEIGEGLLGHIC
jgi:hypothetical protein